MEDAAALERGNAVRAAYRLPGARHARRRGVARARQRPLEAFVDVNPVSHLMTAERHLMTGTVMTGEIGIVPTWRQR
jgi:hypothetical protein